jgi:hypothetical protein
MRRILNCSLIGLLFLAASCGNKGTSTSTGTAVADTAQHQMMGSHAKKYGIKSGIITFSLEGMAATKVKKLYFDDFGAKETSEVYANDKLIQKLINKADGFVYLLEVEKGTGVRSQHAMMTGTEMKFDISNLPDSIKKQYNYIKLPNETICGKDCEVFSTEFQKLKTKYAGWNNIILLTESTMMMDPTPMKTKVIATRIEENVTIPETVWDVPAGVKLTEQ